MLSLVRMSLVASCYRLECMFGLHRIQYNECKRQYLIAAEIQCICRYVCGIPEVNIKSCSAFLCRVTFETRYVTAVSYCELILFHIYAIKCSF